MTPAQIAKEIAETEARLVKLKQLDALMADLNGKPAQKAQQKPTAAKAAPSPASSSRAPKGALEAAILKAVEVKGGMVNREVRAAIKGTGYKFSLSPLHVGKTLTKLVAAKQLEVGHKGGRTEYSTPVPVPS